LTRLSQESPLFEQYIQWKNQQLLSDIVRSQLQQYAVHQVLEKRLQAFDVNHPRTQHVVNHKLSIPITEICISDLRFQWTHPLSSISLQSHWVYLSIGAWTTKTPPVHPSQHGMDWPQTSLTGFLSVNEVHLHDLVVEVVHDKNESSRNIVLGRGRTHLHSVIGCNFGKTCDFEVSLHDLADRSISVGVLRFEVVAQLRDKELDHLPDPFEKTRLEVLGTSGQFERTNIVSQAKDDVCFITGDTYANSTEEKRFRQVVNDLRGDFSTPEGRALTIAQYLSGDFPLSSLKHDSGPNKQLLPVKVGTFFA
jgi:hypothetical protein